MVRELGAAARQERGVTGLETAIIMIAFVVVASVFAFTVLSSGIFAAERGKETIHAGLKGARSSLEIKGSVVANGITDKTLSLANSTWTASSNVTSTANSVDKKEGTASADLLIGASFTTGLVGYEDLAATVDLSTLDSIKLWVKYGTTTWPATWSWFKTTRQAVAHPLRTSNCPRRAQPRGRKYRSESRTMTT